MALTQHAEIEFLMLPVRISSYLHSELSQPHCWERDVTKPGGREVENKAEPKLSCHSATGVLTIIDCHHFLIRPVSKKCGNKTALQKEYPHVPPLLHIHTDNQSCVIYVHTHHNEMCKHIKHVRKSNVPTPRIKQVWLHVTQWIGCTFWRCCRDIPEHTHTPRQQAVAMHTDSW